MKQKINLMTMNKSVPSRQMNSRLIITATAGIILVFEIIFSLFDIPHRPFAPFDLMGPMAILVLIFAKPKMFQMIFRAQFGRLPLIYKIGACITAYVLVIKLVYFVGYLSSVFFKH